MNGLIYNQNRARLLQYCKNKQPSDPLEEELLLTLFLAYARRHTDNRPLARRMLLETGSLFNLTHLPPDALIRTFNISETLAIAISNLGTISNRIQTTTHKKDVLCTISALYHHLRPYFLTGNYESTAIVCLNKKFQYIATETRTLFDPKQTVAAASLILTVARKHFADKIVLAHNHPNTSALELSASSSDLYATKYIIEYLKVNGITLVDHLLIAYDGCCSVLYNDQMPYMDPQLKPDCESFNCKLDYSALTNKKTGIR